MADEKKKTEITIFQTPPMWILGSAFLIMLAAKVFNYSDLSWWVVTVPLWGPFALCVGIFSLFVTIAVVALVFLFVCSLIVEIFKVIFKKRPRKDNDDNEYKLHS